jgi:hypothetical protein
MFTGSSFFCGELKNNAIVLLNISCARKKEA